VNHQYTASHTSYGADKVMLNLAIDHLDFFVWKDFPVIYDGRDEKTPEAWVNIHGHWGRISVESIAFASGWMSRDDFLARFGQLPPLPIELV
jgi:hypothetical protein